MRIATFFFLAALLLLPTARPAGAQTHVFTVQSDQLLEFARELCFEALKASGVNATWSLFPVAPETRLNVELQKGNLHLAFIPPNRERLDMERQGLIKAIRIPLERGLLGYRVCLVKQSRQDILKDASSGDDLRKLVVGQGTGWSDAVIYTNLGIRVVAAPFGDASHPLLALAAGHFDILPLGIGEYRGFLDKFAEKGGTGVVADRHVLIRYPWYRYIWVSMTAPDGALLFRALDKGLERIVANGTFERIYEKHRGKDRPSFMGRRIIDLPSPYESMEDVDPRFRRLIIPPR
jgi:hypothetical protein